MGATPVKREMCSCGEHELAGDPPYESCSLCGHATLLGPFVDWEAGKLYLPICHACSGVHGNPSVLIHLAEPAVLARAHLHGNRPGVEACA